MDLKDYIRVLRSRLVLIVLVTLGAALAAQGITMLTKPLYQATSQLFLAVQGSDSVGDLNQSNTFAQGRVSSYVILATGPNVLGEVSKKTGVPVSELSGTVSAFTPSKTVLIDVAATNQDPAKAAEIANLTAETLVDLVAGVESSSEGEKGVSPVRLAQVQVASIPEAPISPNPLRNLAIGILLGLLIGISTALLIEFLNTRLRSREDIEQVTEASVLGTFAAENTHTENMLLNFGDHYDERAESFRQLRTHLQFSNVDGGLRSILVTSSIAGEGKSTTAANLAMVLSETGVKVLLIDADLRRPTVSNLFGVEGTVGLTTVLTGRVELEEAVQPIAASPGLSVLTSGALPPNPSEMLGSAVMEELLLSAKSTYDIIIIDSPPLVSVSDPSVLSTLASGVLLVTSADGRLHRDELRQSLETLNLVKAKLLGLVLNRVEAGRKNTSYYGQTELEAPRRHTRYKKARNAKQSHPTAHTTAASRRSTKS